MNDFKAFLLVHRSSVGGSELRVDHSHSVINESRKSAWLKGFAMIEMGPYRRLYRLHRTSFAGAGDGAISGVTTLAAPSSIAF
ncbi:hypothetical protein [uncultured Aquabacterium sp.]|uniref:hypothetical protein n=1 Tax=uncultured Aquabacterium sp. TaxID=158753 RepID=UPI0025D96C5D|nr:hypothetical protein [uncultured Aquabacterium sp.]